MLDVVEGVLPPVYIYSDWESKFHLVSVRALERIEGLSNHAAFVYYR
jgi:hypothetical protein